MRQVTDRVWRPSQNKKAPALAVGRVIAIPHRGGALAPRRCCNIRRGAGGEDRGAGRRFTQLGCRARGPSRLGGDRHSAERRARREDQHRGFRTSRGICAEGLRGLFAQPLERFLDHKGLHNQPLSSSSRSANDCAKHPKPTESQCLFQTAKGTLPCRSKLCCLAAPLLPHLSSRTSLGVRGRTRAITLMRTLSLSGSNALPGQIGCQYL